MNGNITSVTDFKTLVQAVSSNLGVDVFFLFILGFLSIIVLINAFRLPKETFPISFLTYSIFWVYLGLIPIWIIPFSMFFNAIIIASKFHIWSNNIIEETVSNFIPKINPVILEEPKTINCKNCGGPNIDKIKCEWCGLILE